MTDDLIEVGFIRAAHGLAGQVVVHAHSGLGESLTQYGALLNTDGSKSFKLTIRNAKDSDFLCKIDGVTERNAAEALRGTKLFVRASSLPAPSDDEFYIRDLIGLTVQNEKSVTLGKVINVIDIGSNSSFDIEFIHDGEKPLDPPQTELLLYTKENVPGINIKARIMTVCLPVGLLETPSEKNV